MRRTFDVGEPIWSRAEPIDGLTLGEKKMPERPPHPGDVFYEAGLVLAVTLGVVASTELLLTLMHIPRP